MLWVNRMQRGLVKLAIVLGAMCVPVVSIAAWQLLTGVLV